MLYNVKNNLIEILTILRNNTQRDSFNPTGVASGQMLTPPLVNRTRKKNNSGQVGPQGRKRNRKIRRGSPVGAGCQTGF